MSVFIAVVAALGWLLAGLMSASKAQHKLDAQHVRAELEIWRNAYHELQREEIRRRIRNGTPDKEA